VLIAFDTDKKSKNGEEITAPTKQQQNLISRLNLLWGSLLQNQSRIFPVFEMLPPDFN
tara:strand:+ start:313 stop:486 length:174 start_codon:yes stop_codon:yes gene_type:complete